MAAADPIDLNQLDQRTLGNTVLRADLLRLFAEHAPILLRELETAMLADNPAAVGKTAHRLAGASATIGADALAQRLREVEALASRVDLRAAKTALPTLSDDISACLAQIKQIFSVLE